MGFQYVTFTRFGPGQHVLRNGKAGFKVGEALPDMVELDGGGKVDAKLGEFAQFS